MTALAEVMGGELLTGDPATMVRGLWIDSREVMPGGAFVAFRGQRVDGHAFVAEALARGARALVVTRHDEPLSAAVEASRRREVALILVPDSLAAVQRAAAWHRSRLDCPVIGITGSTGKTTTKDFLLSALSPLGRVTATAGNRNNELGVPLTLLEAGPDTAALVVEMAMRGPGQIAQLAHLARPTVGLVTNVGVSHFELMGSQAAIAEAKGELVEAVPADGAVFLNGDDATAASLADRALATVTLYGLTEACAVCGRNVRLLDDGRAAFELTCAQGEAEVELPVPGRHNVYNALAAAAVALHLGVDPVEVADGLAAAAMTDMRMQVVDTASGVTVVNDAYNANPVSMRAAIDTLLGMPSRGRRIAVLGGMVELGSLTELAHFELGELVSRCGIDVLVTVGDLGERIADGARADGMDPDVVRPCAVVEEAVEVLDDLLEPGDVVLVKASRAIGLERVVEGVVDPRV